MLPSSPAPGTESAPAPATRRVAGIAGSAGQGFYPQWTPGLIWASPALLAQVEPARSETTEVVGLRL